MGCFCFHPLIPRLVDSAYWGTQHHRSHLISNVYCRILEDDALFPQNFR